MAQTSPPKPWQIRQSSGSTSSSSLRVSSSVANGRALASSTDGTNSSLSPLSASGNLPHVPPRPLSSSSPASYGQRYGSTLDRYGGSYGGYGRYGSAGYGGYDQERPREGYLQSTIDTGASHINKFGQMVEGMSMFSRLLDANFDAMHGSFASVLRLLDVFGEFFYVVKTFALFRGLSAIINWILGRKATPSNRIESGNNSVVSPEDYTQFTSGQRKQKLMPFLLLIMGCIGIPIFLLKVWRKFSERLTQSDQLAKLDTVWQEEPTAGQKPSVDFSKPTLVKAIFDFVGNSRMELNFKQNDVIKVTAKPFPEWWEGEFNGQRGLFPHNFVEPFETSSELPTSKKDV